MSKHIWLSFPLGLEDPRPPAIPAPELSFLYTVEKDGANVQVLRLANHTGTHLDAPRHVIADGVCITDYSPQELIFLKPLLVDLCMNDAEIVMPEDLEPHTNLLKQADLALFRFGYAQVRRTDPQRFSQRCPGFGVEAARWLRSTCPNLRAIGMDVPSLACIAHLDQTLASHNELLGGEARRFLVIEDMIIHGTMAGNQEPER